MAFLTDQDRRRIADAIAAAERRTSGELVTVVAEAAGDYRSFPLLWPALAALLLPAILSTVLPGIAAWPLYLAQAASFVGLALIAHLPPVRIALVPAAVKRRRAARLAREQFFAQGLQSAGANGPASSGGSAARAGNSRCCRRTGQYRFSSQRSAIVSWDKGKASFPAAALPRL